MGYGFWPGRCGRRLKLGIVSLELTEPSLRPDPLLRRVAENGRDVSSFFYAPYAKTSAVVDAMLTPG